MPPSKLQSPSIQNTKVFCIAKICSAQSQHTVSTPELLPKEVAKDQPHAPQPHHPHTPQLSPQRLRYATEDLDKIAFAARSLSNGEPHRPALRLTISRSLPCSRVLSMYRAIYLEQRLMGLSWTVSLWLHLDLRLVLFDLLGLWCWCEIEADAEQCPALPKVG